MTLNLYLTGMNLKIKQTEKIEMLFKEMNTLTNDSNQFV